MAELAAENESLIRDLGLERYWSMVKKAKTNKNESVTPAGTYLLKQASAEMTSAVAQWMAKVCNRPSACQQYVQELEHVDPLIIAHLSARTILDTISLEVAYTATAVSVGDALEQEALHRKVVANRHQFLGGLATTKHWRAASQRSRRIWLKKEYQRQTGQHGTWPYKAKAAIGTALIEMFIRTTGLVEVRRKRMLSGRTSMFLAPTDATLVWLEKSNEAHSLLYPFYLPEPEPPLDWTTLTDGGYMYEPSILYPLIKGASKEALAAMQDADLSQIYSAVNAVQRCPWQINRRVLELMRWFHSRGLEVGGLPPTHDIVPPARPDEADKDATRGFKKAAGKIFALNRHYKSARLTASRVLFMADQIGDAAIYFPCQLDFRGRLYPKPSLLNFQGPDLARALLAFRDGCYVQKHGPHARWLALEGAARYGKTKMSYDDRLRWVESQADYIIRTADDPYDFDWWASAKQPWQFLAWCFEWAELLKKGSVFSHQPIHMDGTNNGLQVLSMVMRDPSSAAATNCMPSTPADMPHDMYQAVADLVHDKLRAVAYGSPDTFRQDLAKKWLRFIGDRLDRSVLKPHVMTLPYGSTMHSTANRISDWYIETAYVTGAEFPFALGDIHAGVWFLASIVQEAVSESASSALRAMAWLRQVSDVCSRHNQGISWVSPSGLPITQKCTRWSSDLVRTMGGERVRRLTIRTPNDELAPRKQSQSISANFVHSLDAAVLVKTINRLSQAGVTSMALAHDSYGVLASDASVLNTAVRESFVEVFSHNQLENFRDCVMKSLPETATLPALPSLGDLDPRGVLNSTYLFS